MVGDFYDRLIQQFFTGDTPMFLQHVAVVISVQFAVDANISGRALDHA